MPVRYALLRSPADTESAPLDGLSVRRGTIALAPLAGTVATPRHRARSPGASGGMKGSSRSTIGRTTSDSMLASAAPTQRLTPPPTGIQATGLALVPMYRSGLNDPASGKLSSESRA